MKDNILNPTEKALRAKWRDVGNDVSADSPEAVRRAIGRRRSLVARLKRRYMTTAVLGITAPAWMVTLASMTPVSALLVACYCVFCVGIGCLNLFLWYRIGEVPGYMTMPLLEAQQRIISLDKLRRNLKYLGWVLGIPVIALLFYEMDARGDDGILWGGVIGGVIGFAVGITIEIKNRRQMKGLVRFFSSEERTNPSHCASHK